MNSIAYNLEDDIIVLENFEPRININVKVRISYPINTNELNVSIGYDIVGLSIIRQNVDFILQSTRI